MRPTGAGLSALRVTTRDSALGLWAAPGVWTWVGAVEPAADLEPFGGRLSKLSPCA